MIRLFTLLFCFCLSTSSAEACTCSSPALTANYQEAAFVAKVKIINSVADPQNKEYHDVTYELISLYKGKRGSKLKANTSLSTSCAFMPKNNSEWLVFAYEYNGILSFHYCGSYQIYPQNTDIPIKAAMLQFLKDKKIKDPNPLKLYAMSEEVRKIRGFKNDNYFAAFKMELHVDRSVYHIKTLKEFTNKALQNAVVRALKTDLRLFGSRSEKPRAVEMIVFCAFYKGNDKNQSSVSTLIL